jgi:hypothetical protein
VAIRLGSWQAAGPGTAALELDGVTPVLAGGGARSAATQSLSPFAASGRCRRWVGETPQRSSEPDVNM